jgi:hypothetical protein
MNIFRIAGLGLIRRNYTCTSQKQTRLFLTSYEYSLARFELFSVFVLAFMTSPLMWAADNGFPALSAVVTCVLRVWVMNTTLFFIVWPLLMYGTAIPNYFLLLPVLLVYDNSYGRQTYVL